MRLPHAALPIARTLVVGVFVACCTVVIGYLWLNSGGRLPLISQTGYRITVALPDIDNLVTESDVKRAGVDVGRVVAISVDGSVTGGRAVATLRLDPAATPLHQGATVRVRNKTLIEESYLDITDGTGPALPAGAVLPPDAGRPSVQFDDVLASLDPPTRTALGSLLRSSGVATAGRRDDISRAVAGLGAVGREGTDGLTALAAQSDDLRRLTVHTTAVLRALDTQQGRIASLVTDAEEVFRTTAQGRRDIEALTRRLPPLLSAAQGASTSITTLANELAPVAANLHDAGPDLSVALRQLPGTAADLRGLLPSLDRTLGRAPDTLERVPAFSDDLRVLFPTLHTNLSDLNPALAFLAPYGADMAAFFTNFSASVGPGDGNGKVMRLMFLFNDQTPNSPIGSNIGPLDKRNSVPKPGSSVNPNPHGDSEQPYPRIEKESAPR